MNTYSVAIWMAVALILFLSPTWMAAKGRRLSVGLVNVLFGWTVIGWGVALIMAVRSREQAAWKRGEWQ